jgi:excisionase family DNA binding protein
MFRPREREKTLLSVQQVADILNVSTKTVRRMLQDGKLNFHRIATAIRVSDEDLYAYIRSTRE